MIDTEEDLARLVIDWLKDQEWDVYQEVETQTYGIRADIVAKRGPLLWVIETKMRLCLSVVDQAMNWLPYAHYCSVAFHKYGGGSGLLHWAMTYHGIGMIHGESYGVYETFPPRLRRRVSDRLEKALCEEQKTYAPAGNAESKRYTPFQGTCDRIREFLSTYPGAYLKTVVESVDHHYSSSSTARSALAKWLQLGKIPGVRMEYQGRRIRLFLDKGVGGVV